MRASAWVGNNPPVPSTLPYYRSRVADLLELGVPLERVERELIDRVALDEDHRAALWLYAWTLAARSGAPHRPERSDRQTFDRPRGAAAFGVLARVASVAAAIIHLPGM
jgi:hypothetical protein